MSGRFVRASKYRHVHATPFKPEATYGNLRVNCVGDGNFIAGNRKFFAIPYSGGGGPVAVINYSQVGKLPTVIPVLNHHTQPVLDIDFHPFNEHVVATASSDTSICVYGIPEGGLTDSINDSLAKFDGHQKNVGFIKWNPCANNILASASHDLAVKVWDVENGAEAFSFSDMHPDLINSMDWNYNGSLLGTSCKDHSLRLFDPRNPSAVATTVGFDGAKATRLTFLGESHRLLAVGFNRTSMRQFGIWDERKFDNPLSVIPIDQGAGIIMPFFDVDTNVLYLAGKGDGNIRYYEIVDEEPYAYVLSEHRTTAPQRGCCMLPKRAVNVLECEITRILKLERDRVEPIQFIVPRKSDAFAEDIFPETLGPVPNTSADQWLQGRNVLPDKISLRPGAEQKDFSAMQAASFKPVKSARELEKELAHAQETIESQAKRIKELEERLAALGH